MPEPDKAAVEKRAKELAEKDGFAWELNFTPPQRSAGTHQEPGIVLT